MGKSKCDDIEGKKVGVEKKKKKDRKKKIKKLIGGEENRMKNPVIMMI